MIDTLTPSANASAADLITPTKAPARLPPVDLVIHSGVGNAAAKRWMETMHTKTHDFFNRRLEFSNLTEDLRIHFYEASPRDSLERELVVGSARRCLGVVAASRATDTATVSRIREHLRNVAAYAWTRANLDGRFTTEEVAVVAVPATPWEPARVKATCQSVVHDITPPGWADNSPKIVDISRNNASMPDILGQRISISTFLTIFYAHEINSVEMLRRSIWGEASCIDASSWINPADQNWHKPSLARKTPR